MIIVQKVNEALVAFKAIIEKPSGEYTELADLGKAGWEELCPKEAYWSFSHADHPGIIVRWSPGGWYGPKAVTVG